MSPNLKLLFLLISLFSLGQTIIKIPFEMYPTYVLNDTDPQSYMTNLINKKMYGKIKIGTPEQESHIHIDFRSNDFYLLDGPKHFYEEHPKYFSSFNFYEPDKSTSIKRLEEIDAIVGENFKIAEYVNDKFVIGERKMDLDFWLGSDPSDPKMGGIGLQLLPFNDLTISTVDEKRTFLKKLKDKGVINNYIWSVFFDKKEYQEKDTGFILIGEFPHNVKEDLAYYKKNDFNEKQKEEVNAHVNLGNKQLYLQFSFDEVYAYKQNDVNKKIESLNFGRTESLKVTLDYELEGFVGSDIFHQYLKDYVFKQAINNGDCFEKLGNILFTGYYYFYCKKNKNVLSKIKENFPAINFRSSDLRANFSITPDELFIEKGDYYFCIMVFEDIVRNSWKLGVPFLKKYQFSLNMESKKIGYYSTEDKKESVGGIKSSTFVIVIILASAICIGLGIFIGKLIYDKYIRKKRANELEDNYDYETAEKDVGEAILN